MKSKWRSFQFWLEKCLWVFMFLAFLSIMIAWNKNVGHRYDGEVFFVSDTQTPEIKDITFSPNTDGTYTAKLYGIFPAGVCRIEKSERPSVYTPSMGIVIPSAGVGSVAILKFSFENSPAELAGLRVGDYLYSCNGHVISNTDWSLGAYIDVEGENEITVIRDGKYLTKTIIPNSDGKIGISYGPTINVVGTVSFVDDGYFWAIGHNTELDVTGSPAYFSLLTDVDGKIESEIPENPLQATILRCTDRGVFGRITSEGYSFLSDPVDIAWEWEIQENADAKVQLAVIGEEEHTVRVKSYNGVLSDKKTGQVIRTYDYMLESDDFEFLRGMSGSPVFQNNRLIGVLAAVDVDDPRIAFMVSAEKIYLQYQECLAAEEGLLCQ